MMHYAVMQRIHATGNTKKGSHHQNSQQVEEGIACTGRKASLSITLMRGMTLPLWSRGAQAKLTSPKERLVVSDMK